MKTEAGEVFETDYPEYHNNAVVLTGAAAKQALHAQRVKDLKKLIKPGQSVYTKLNSVSASGMTRDISVYVVYKNEIKDISYHVCKVTGYPAGKTGVKAQGCGMDMGFDIVYTLGCYLWPTGTPKPHGVRNGEPDTAGGYALKHSWI